MKVTVKPCREVRGSLQVPGDKSISHRSLLFGALAEGTTEVTGLSGGEDVRSSRRCVEAMGVKISAEGERLFVTGSAGKLKAPLGPLDCGNSGTTIRLLMGILVGQTFDSVLVGDPSLSRRPMKRVAEPLARFGARIELTSGNYPPVKVRGVGKLKAAEVTLEVASAQVKSALCLAALNAEGTTRLTGKIHSRDHTERMLRYFGVPLETGPDFISIPGGARLLAKPVNVPGDPSSAAFWAGAAALKGEVAIENLLLNPTRTGFFEVLKRMGAVVTIRQTSEAPEPVGTLTVTAGKLRGTTVGEAEIPSLIDEIPLLAVLATFAEGVTEVRGAEELRVKETDRIEAVAENLRRMGAQLETYEDGFRLVGPQKLKGAVLDSFGDHRIAMAFAIGALGAEGETVIEDAGSVAISYPDFFRTLENVARG